MKLRNLYLVHAVVVLLYALALLLITQTILAAYGLSTNTSDVLVGQFFGVGLLTSGLVTLLARDVTDPAAKTAINYAEMISAAVGFIISIGATLSKTMNSLGWSAVVLFGFFAVAFAYFQFFNPEP